MLIVVEEGLALVQARRRWRRGHGGGEWVELQRVEFQWRPVAAGGFVVVCAQGGGARQEGVALVAAVVGACCCCGGGVVR